MEASVVDLPDPVGPVTRISPFSRSQSCRTFGGNVSEDSAKSPVLNEDIHAKSGYVAQFEGKIALAFFLEILSLGIAHHVIDQRMRFFRGQCGMIEFLEIPVHTNHRWLAGADVTIRRALLSREGQEFRNIHEEDSSV